MNVRCLFQLLRLLKICSLFRYLPLLMGVAVFAWGCNSLSRSSPKFTVGKPVEMEGVHNTFVLGDKVLSGSVPENDAAFEALRRKGVKTIISVDGARPDVEAARRHGMRYVHLPHGYDGIGTNIQAQLAQAAIAMPGPIYVHCHHGRHRGPAAAAIVCMTVEGWAAGQGEAWLRQAGTDTNYHGLFGAVRTFQRPSEEVVRRSPVNLPEIATVSGLVDAMVGLDQTWERLKAVRAASYNTPAQHPDMLPKAEARLLTEHFRESQRLPDAVSRGGEFVEWLAKSELLSRELEQQLAVHARQSSPTVRLELDRTMDALTQACTDCHKRYRNKSSVREAR